MIQSSALYSLFAVARDSIDLSLLQSPRRDRLNHVRQRQREQQADHSEEQQAVLLPTRSCVQRMKTRVSAERQTAAVVDRVRQLQQQQGQPPQLRQPVVKRRDQKRGCAERQSSAAATTATRSAVTASSASAQLVSINK